jgi:DNA-directed RNA polymerase subunit RPC12/RpoP
MRLQLNMAVMQTKCFRCYKELTSENEKAWMDNDGLCPNCSTSLSVEDETCYNCDKPAIQDDQILFCVSCFELMAEGEEDE